MFTLKNGVALRVCAILVLVLGGSVFSDTEAQTNWWPEIRLTDDPSASIISGSNARSVAADTGGNICVVWTDYRCGPVRVYYKIFDGSVWTPDSALTPANSNGHDPAIAADGDGCLHVVWTDYRNGNAEIYHKVRDPGILSGTVTTDKGIVPPEPVRVLPNPVRTSAHVVLAVPYRSETNVSVYDITGRLVRTWDLGVQAPGRHNLAWDPTDSHGRPVAPGVYFLEVATGNRSASAKVIVLR